MWQTLLLILKILAVVNAAILIALILVQRSKSGGGLGGLTGNIGESTFGTGATAAFMKATVILAALFLVLVLGIGRLHREVREMEGESLADEPGEVSVPANEEETIDGEGPVEESPAIPPPPRAEDLGEPEPEPED